LISKLIDSIGNYHWTKAVGIDRVTKPHTGINGQAKTRNKAS
jgi:hypothetical protein